LRLQDAAYYVTFSVIKDSNDHCILVQLVSSKFPIVVKIGHAHAGSGKVSCFSLYFYSYLRLLCL